ncbi:hypothetical protein PH242_20610 [Photorhabdus bodei]|uniref:hypothetical protein n=1 Tax=Photorhabdus bodei TaxID=2029681 RepID=UPI00233111F0|nr:hypothetical protein [Photorhabdus bodei]MDB6369988.1 hypothetical protein [Photorhabdus bodei]
MFIIHPRIKLFYDLREAITPELALADTYQLMNHINNLSNNSSGWHLPGYIPVIFQVASLLAALAHPGHIVIYAPGDSLPCRRDAS